jgi:hypothetical protein
MKISKKSRKRVNRLKELIDFWSIPHFLFGAVTALGAIVFLIPAWSVFFATFIFAVAWEFFERWQGIVESIRNRISDVCMPLVAFPATFLFARYVTVEHERQVSLFVVITILFLYTNFMAWKARFARDRDFTD